MPRYAKPSWDATGSPLPPRSPATTPTLPPWACPPIHSVSIDDTQLVHLPILVGLLQRDHDRIVAINGRTGQTSQRMSHLLSSQRSHIRGAFNS